MVGERELRGMFISNKAVGDRLRIARNRRKLTQAQVAEELGLSEKHYGHIERGTRIASLELLGHLCTLYQVPLEELIAGVLVNPPQMDKDRPRDKQISNIGSMLSGVSDKGVEMVEEMIRALTKYENQ